MILTDAMPTKRATDSTTTTRGYTRVCTRGCAATAELPLHQKTCALLGESTRTTVVAGWYGCPHIVISSFTRIQWRTECWVFCSTCSAVNSTGSVIGVHPCKETTFYIFELRYSYQNVDMCMFCYVFHGTKHCYSVHNFALAAPRNVQPPYRLRHQAFAKNRGPNDTDN